MEVEGDGEDGMCDSRAYNWGVVVHLAEELLQRGIFMSRKLGLWKGRRSRGRLSLGAIRNNSRRRFGILWGWVGRHLR